MADEFRKSGIPLMDRIPWGAHICLFYETRQDLLQTVADYFAAGLAANELCMWAISEPISVQDATLSLRALIPDFDRYLADGAVELVPGREWYLPDDEFDLRRITDAWAEKQRHALARGYDGIRVSGDAFWVETDRWRQFADYEDELDRSLSGHPILVLCTYALHASRAVDVLDVMRAHNFTLARRHGEWQFMEMPDLKPASERIEQVPDALPRIPVAFPGHEHLTERERTVLAQMVTGASSKEAARMLGISPRTVEFHRANIMEKLGARNTADVIRRVLSKN